MPDTSTLRGLLRLNEMEIVGWLTGPGLRVLFVVVAAYVLLKALHLLIARLRVPLPGEASAVEVAEWQKRFDTVSRLLRGLASLVVVAIAAMMVLRELGLDITPILTGAGIAGLAVGFGAQHLVRDIIAGLFLILEDQVRVGDVAVINGKGGLVEAIRLRTIVLRDLDGRVHIVPNGAINELSNLTKDYSYYVMDVGVAYRESVDRVMGVLREIGAELAKDPTYADKIMEPLEILGVDAFGDSAVIIKIRLKTLPRQQWLVGRELRRRLKNAFDARGIEIPYPALSVYFGEASKPFAVQVSEREPSPPGPTRGSSS